ncbi:CGNR zinc finger domain-containing protein [Phyllobacterium myrsinacearum]|uniref:Putative RNA-binding Zn ribbon-like protein n=1 Tax=Phyllobacterium myrsinacearum TaxID=28101 RepID=A0A839EL51_9HYPH|nr:CGNR zinc finger domain-containing protein [Phyllobacterium myrsinacearum]MBA8881213.1 putative RNA-binding Zn ribbon-like protein [Phyllobacterium myrsinacearum]
MTFDWNAHRFSGGVLALDLANTVIFRETPDRAMDRFSDRGELERFAAAAAHFRKQEWGKVKFQPPREQAEVDRIVDVREAINALFRTAVRGGGLRPDALATFLKLGSVLVFDESMTQNLAWPNPGSAVQGEERKLSLGTAAFLSAMRLLEPARLERIKICPNCHWLYFDESRNRSRRWCDMTVCGNRAKAQRHYRRNRGQPEHDHA